MTRLNWPPSPRLRRVTIAAVFENPLAGKAAGADLKPLIDYSRELGASLTKVALATLGASPAHLRAYTKAALVGISGDLEHGVAMIHPRLGMAMRSAIKRGRVIIPGHAKGGPPGVAQLRPVSKGCQDVCSWPYGHTNEAALYPIHTITPDRPVQQNARPGAAQRWTGLFRKMPTSFAPRRQSGSLRMLVVSESWLRTFGLSPRLAVLVASHTTSNSQSNSGQGGINAIQQSRSSNYSENHDVVSGGIVNSKNHGWTCGGRRRFRAGP